MLIFSLMNFSPPVQTGLRDRPGLTVRILSLTLLFFPVPLIALVPSSFVDPSFFFPAGKFDDQCPSELRCLGLPEQSSRPVSNNPQLGGGRLLPSDFACRKVSGKALASDRPVLFFLKFM